MFIYDKRIETEANILSHFKSNVGSLTNDTHLDGGKIWVSTDELKQELLFILENNDIPYEMFSCSRVIPWLMDEKISAKYEIRYILMNLPNWPTKHDDITKQINEFVDNHVFEIAYEYGIQMDDYFIQRLNSYNLRESYIRYICVSSDDIMNIEDICQNLRLKTPEYIIPGDGLDWVYIVQKLESEWVNNKWEFFDDNPNYDMLLRNNKISYVGINDHHNKLTSFSVIFEPSQYRSEYRKDLKKLLRSSWEANISRIFNYLGIEWDYEREQFDMGENLRYQPDFFLARNTILEVKGFWDTYSREKVTEFQKKHPEYRVLILDADMYYSLKGKYSHLIPEWEDDGDMKQYSETIPIVGMRFCASANMLNSLRVGDIVLFKREPENKYDKYAILALTENGEPIGHVASDWSFIYASKMDLGMEYSAKISKISANSIQIRISRTNTDRYVVYEFFK